MVETILQSLTWLGHDGYCLKSAGKVIYFDPFQLTGSNLAPADLVFISHGHRDHFSPEDLGEIATEQTTFVTEKSVAKKLSGKVEVVAPGDSIEIEGFLVEAVPAYNINKKFHPEVNGWLGFIVTVDGVRIYHAGDTDFIPEMKQFCADIALLPVSGTYVMTALEAAQAALAIKPQVAIPMHYGSIVGTADDARAFAAALKGKVRVELLR
jgi:L-ascorbate metabolism protein UlaG (beta-lactamase superfamily)